MDFMVVQDIESVMEIAGLTTGELADALEVSRVTVSNWLNRKTVMTDHHMEAFYRYAFRKGIRLNRIKEQFYREDMVSEHEALLFHGAKTRIDVNLSIDCSIRINDFGNGFYCGESPEQSAMFVATYPKSTLYMLKFDPTGLVSKRFGVDREWMLTIAFFRGRLDAYKNTAAVRRIAQVRNGIDYIIAPIADNRVFEIIDSFIDGEITDVQCQHCLSATNLGMQYVFVSDNALKNVTLLEKCYLAAPEKEAYLNARQESNQMSQDKVKLARKQYRNQGEYIEDVLK